MDSMTYCRLKNNIGKNLIDMAAIITKFITTRTTLQYCPTFQCSSLDSWPPPYSTPLVTKATSGNIYTIVYIFYVIVHASIEFRVIMHTIQVKCMHYYIKCIYYNVIFI